MEALGAKTTVQNIFRPLADFPASIWGFSLASLSLQNSEFESYTRQVQVLKEKVKEMLVESNTDPAKSIEFINLLCRLGVSYHLEDEIEVQLNHIFRALPDVLHNNDYGLHTTALLFRVLRQHGYKISSNVFTKFKDTNGKFKKSIVNDVEGILSLYEASYLSMHGEEVLDEALVFSTATLKSLARQASPLLAKKIKNALVRPFHQGVPRIEARQYICLYEEDESRNETLLEFAKLDYNRVLLLHQQDLGIVSRWWKELNVVDKLPYARDRIAEAFVWGAGTHSEPQYSLVRILVAKFIMAISLVDDTYDAYGTFEEAQFFTQAIDRFDMGAMDHLPADYLKVVFNVVLNLFAELENEASKEGKSHLVPYVKEAFKGLVRGYHQEAKWVHDGCVPPFNEYLQNGLLTSTYGVMPAVSFMGLGDNAGINEYEWLKSNPKSVIAAQLVTRLMDDIVTHEDERKRGFCTSGVECYMKEHGVSEEEATKELQKMVANAWKDINEECIRPTAVPKPLLMHVLNLTRLIDFVYKYNDAYTYSKSLEDDIISLFLKPLPMQASKQA